MLSPAKMDVGQKLAELNCEIVGQELHVNGVPLMDLVDPSTEKVQAAGKGSSYQRLPSEVIERFRALEQALVNGGDISQGMVVSGDGGAGADLVSVFTRNPLNPKQIINTVYSADNLPEKLEEILPELDEKDSLEDSLEKSRIDSHASTSELNSVDPSTSAKLVLLHDAVIPYQVMRATPVNPVANSAPAADVSSVVSATSVSTSNGVQVQVRLSEEQLSNPEIRPRLTPSEISAYQVQVNTSNNNLNLESPVSASPKQALLTSNNNGLARLARVLFTEASPDDGSDIVLRDFERKLAKIKVSKPKDAKATDGAERVLSEKPVVKSKARPVKKIKAPPKHRPGGGKPRAKKMAIEAAPEPSRDEKLKIEKPVVQGIALSTTMAMENRHVQQETLETEIPLDELVHVDVVERTIEETIDDIDISLEPVDMEQELERSVEQAIGEEQLLDQLENRVVSQEVETEELEETTAIVERVSLKEEIKIDRHLVEVIQERQEQLLAPDTLPLETKLEFRNDGEVIQHENKKVELELNPKEALFIESEKEEVEHRPEPKEAIERTSMKKSAMEPKTKQGFRKIEAKEHFATVERVARQANKPKRNRKVKKVSNLEKKVQVLKELKEEALVQQINLNMLLASKKKMIQSPYYIESLILELLKELDLEEYEIERILKMLGLTPQAISNIRELETMLDGIKRDIVAKRRLSAQ